MDILETPIEWAKRKAETISEINKITKRDALEVIAKALSIKEGVFVYAIDVIKYNGSITPTFKTVIGTFKNPSEAIQYVSETEEIEDILEDCNDFKSSILQVRKVLGIPKKYSEKEMLASWHYILRNIKMETILINGKEVTITNKGILSRELSRQYGIRNNYLLDLYKKKYNNGIGGQ